MLAVPVTQQAVKHLLSVWIYALSWSFIGSSKKTVEGHPFSIGWIAGVLGSCYLKDQKMIDIKTSPGESIGQWMNVTEKIAGMGRKQVMDISLPCLNNLNKLSEARMQGIKTSQLVSQVWWETQNTT